MRRVSIKEDFKNDYISRAAGERLRRLILDARAENKTIEVDFTGITVASTSFFDEAFAKLHDEGWNEKDFHRYIAIKGLHRLDREVLARVTEYRGLNVKL